MPLGLGLGLGFTHGLGIGSEGMSSNGKNPGFLGLSNWKAGHAIFPARCYCFRGLFGFISGEGW